MVGVIGHLPNPSLDENVRLAQACESAGASWIGFADAFWWRDVWIGLAAAADATTTIEIGAAMTNAYLRHPFHTASAIATLQELAPGRVFVGITAGGSEVTAAAGVARTDAPDRVRDLAELLRKVADGQPLDPTSGRRLDVPLAPVPVLVAGRGQRMLRTAGEVADRVLLWAIPDSELERSVELVRSGATTRDRAPQLIWAPLVEHDPRLCDEILFVAVYAALNTRREVRRAWGLGDRLVDEIRSHLVAGRRGDAAALVPDAALDDLVVSGDPDAVAARARSLGCSAIAVPGFGIDSVADHVAWARRIEAELS